MAANTKPVKKKNGKKDPQNIAKNDPNKFNAKSLAEKIKERKRMNQEALKLAGG